jgi:hypothetical protein
MYQCVDHVCAEWWLGCKGCVFVYVVINSCVGCVNRCRYVSGIGDGRVCCCVVLLPSQRIVCVVVGLFQLFAKTSYLCASLTVSYKCRCVCSGSGPIVKM